MSDKSRHRLSLEAQRSAERSAINSGDVYLPNPNTASFDKKECQEYEQSVYGLGLAPNIPKHFWQLLNGDSGAGASVYRTSEIFQRLASPGERQALTPYSKAIQVATIKSTDQRPRYFHASLFSVGIVFRSNVAPTLPLSTDDVKRFAAGIPAGTTLISGNTQFGVPQFSTTKFRIMIHDESGQRFIDVDVIGTRSLNLYGFGVTVFALIKEAGYQIDRQRDDNPSLGSGTMDQGVIGARIIPIRSNEKKNINNRTVSIIAPGNGADPTVVPIPPGARRVQGYSDAASQNVVIFFACIDPLDSALTVGTSQGRIDFFPFGPIPGSRTNMYAVPNANSIVIINGPGDPSRIFTFVFEVTS